MHNSPKYIIHFVGHSCSGKSTVSNILVSRIPGLYSITYDMLKRRLTGYDRDKHSSLIRDIQLKFLDVVCSKGLPIYLEYPTRDKESYERCLSIAHAYGYTYITFVFTASKEVLIERFKERLISIATHGGKASINTMEAFQKSLEQPFYYGEEAIVVDTSLLDVDSVVQKILDTIDTL